MPKFSVEGIIGLLLEVVLGILDHLHVKEPFIIWGLFLVGLVLMSHAVIQSDWATKAPTKAATRKRRVLAMIPVLLFFACFGWWIFLRDKALHVPNQASVSQATTSPSPAISSVGEPATVTSKPKIRPLTGARLQEVLRLSEQYKSLHPDVDKDPLAIKHITEWINARLMKEHKGFQIVQPTIPPKQAYYSLSDVHVQGAKTAVQNDDPGAHFDFNHSMLEGNGTALENNSPTGSFKFTDSEIKNNLKGVVNNDKTNSTDTQPAAKQPPR